MKTEARSTPAPTPVPPAAPIPSAARQPPAFKRFLIYWLPVLLWMALIFGFSTNMGSSRNTSRIIGPILRWFVPDVSDETINAVQTVARKGGHLTEYAVLAFLVWRARRQPAWNRPQTWRRSDAAVAIAIATLFAISDELHQSTVPSRQGQATDVLIDSAGACLGMFGLWALGRRFKQW